MDKRSKCATPHPQLLDFLFAYKSPVAQVFKEVIGLHGIDHIALARISQNNQLITLSSTPSLEYNLFRTGLWRYDLSYNPQWINLENHSFWQTLYSPDRYDELYYLKQIRHGFETGLSYAKPANSNHYVYSFASQKNNMKIHEVMLNSPSEIYEIGNYFMSRLQPIYLHCEEEPIFNYALTA